MIEINASCPNVNVKQDIIQICKTARYATCHPLILKISYLHPVQIAQEASEYLNAVHAINSVPWGLIFPNKKSPLAKYDGGGVSGPIIAPFAREKVRELAEKTNLPIIAGGGISSWKDIQIFQELGASAFSIGSLFLGRPWLPNKIIKAQ